MPNHTLQPAPPLPNQPREERDAADVWIPHPIRLFAACVLAAVCLLLLFGRLQSRAANLRVDRSQGLSSFGAPYYLPGNADPSERVRDIAFSPDGAFLAIVRDNGFTQIFDVVHRELRDVHPNRRPVAYIRLTGSPKALHENIFVGPGNKFADQDNKPAVSVAFNSTGSLLASGAEDGAAHVWSVHDGREVLRVSHGSPLSQVAFRPKTNQLLTAGDDGHVRIFDAAKVIADFALSDKVVAASFSPAGNLLAARCYDGLISVFDVEHRQLVRTLGGGDAAFNLAFSGNGKRLATAGGSFAFVWDVTTGKQLLQATHAIAPHTLTTNQWITDVALSADGRLLAYAARGKPFAAHVWNIETGHHILELKHDSTVSAVAFNADGTKLGTASYDETARLWELPSGKEIGRAAHPQGAEVVAFSQQGNVFAAGGMGGSVSVSQR